MLILLDYWQAKLVRKFCKESLFPCIKSVKNFTKQIRNSNFWKNFLRIEKAQFYVEKPTFFIK